MPFHAILSPSVIEKLRQLRVGHGTALIAGIRALEQNPDRLSRRPVFPYADIGHIYHFKDDAGDGLTYFTVFFVFGPGDNDISITDFTMMPPPSLPPSPM